ncbi:MAG: multidrug effflux MFS transporter [Gammaproteobacteria bacterium]|jgi:Bcr/CflA subfamily drug resistance transporter
MKSLIHLFLITVFLAALGQIASDIYLPSLPYMVHALHTNTSLVQFTVAAFMLGFCMPRLVYGITSDAFGRKTPLLIGLLICLIGGIICSLAFNVWMVIVGRLLQGLGAAAGVTVTGAMVRDCFEGADLAKFESYRAATIVTVLSCIPLLGGYIQHYLNWRANFIATLIYTIFVLGLFFLLPETNQHKDASHVKPKYIKENTKTLLGNKHYLAYGVCIFMSYAGILAWLTLGPILLQNSLHFSSVQFGWAAMVVGISYVIGALTNGKLVKRFGMHCMLKTATYVLITSALFLILFAMLGVLNIYVILIPVAFFVMGTGLVFANAYTGALTPFPKIAGLACSILGTLQILGGFIASSAISILPDTSQMPLAVIILICAISCFIAAKIGMRSDI